jgi:hypothetical protein
MTAIPRFEIRSAHTGQLEAVHPDVESAIQYAGELRDNFGERFFIIDLHLAPIDDRIVWRQGEVSAQAREHLRSVRRRYYGEALL